MNDLHDHSSRQEAVHRVGDRKFGGGRKSGFRSLQRYRAGRRATRSEGCKGICPGGVDTSWSCRAAGGGLLRASERLGNGSEEEKEVQPVKLNPAAAIAMTRRIINPSLYGPAKLPALDQRVSARSRNEVVVYRAGIQLTAKSDISIYISLFKSILNPF